MTMSRKDRFRLKSQVLAALGSSEWSLDRTNLLLSEFQIEKLGGSWSDPTLVEIINAVSDSTLAEIHSLVTGIESGAIEDVAETAGFEERWKPGYVRVFLSHSAHHKEFVGEVADELEVLGIHGFVAHETIEHSKPWQSQMEQALHSMQAFVALIHPEFNESAWCNQEVGWARGRRVPYYAVRLGSTPEGFIGHNQWPSVAEPTPGNVARVVSSWVSALPELGTTVTEGLFEALRSATSYFDAGKAAELIASIGSLTPEQFGKLDEIFWSNDQVYGGALPSKPLRQLYMNNGRQWPPPKP